MGDAYVASVERNGFSRLVQFASIAVVTNPSPDEAMSVEEHLVAGVDAHCVLVPRSASETEIQRWAERFVEPVDSMRYLLSSRCSRTFAEPSIPTSLMYATASSSVQKERYSGSISTFGCFSTRSLNRRSSSSSGTSTHAEPIKGSST